MVTFSHYWEKFVKNLSFGLKAEVGVVKDEVLKHQKTFFKLSIYHMADFCCLCLRFLFFFVIRFWLLSNRSLIILLSLTIDFKTTNQEILLCLRMNGRSGHLRKSLRMLNLLSINRGGRRLWANTAECVIPKPVGLLLVLLIHSGSLLPWPLLLLEWSLTLILFGNLWVRDFVDLVNLSHLLDLNFLECNKVFEPDHDRDQSLTLNLSKGRAL